MIWKTFEEDVDNLRIVSWTALFLGVAGTAGLIGSIGMQLFPDGTAGLIICLENHTNPVSSC